MLGRQREDVAAGGKDRPVAVGSYIEVGMLRRILLTDRVFGIDPARPRAGPVVRYGYVDVVKLLRRNIEDMQLATLLEHDGGIGAGAQARIIDVVVRKVGDLTELAAAGVVGPDVLAPAGIMISEEINGLAEPHG